MISLENYTLYRIKMGLQEYTLFIFFTQKQIVFTFNTVLQKEKKVGETSSFLI